MSQKTRVVIHAKENTRSSKRRQLAKHQGNNRIQTKWREHRRVTLEPKAAMLFDLANKLSGQERQRLLDKVNVMSSKT